MLLLVALCVVIAAVTLHYNPLHVAAVKGVVYAAIARVTPCRTRGPIAAMRPPLSLEDPEDLDQ